MSTTRRPWGRVAGLLLILGMVSFASCSHRPPARGIAGTLADDHTIEGAIQSVDATARLRGGASGGGGMTNRGSGWEASYAYSYHGLVDTGLEVEALVQALRKELTTRIELAGGTVEKTGGGAAKTRLGPDEPLQVRHVTEGYRYSLHGYHGDIFVVAYPAYDFLRANYRVVVRVTEVLLNG